LLINKVQLEFKSPHYSRFFRTISGLKGPKPLYFENKLFGFLIVHISNLSSLIITPLPIPVSKFE
jgi:hypothetical protein